MGVKPYYFVWPNIDLVLSRIYIKSLWKVKQMFVHWQYTLQEEKLQSTQLCIMSLVCLRSSIVFVWVCESTLLWCWFESQCWSTFLTIFAMSPVSWQKIHYIFLQLRNSWNSNPINASSSRACNIAYVIGKWVDIYMSRPRQLSYLKLSWQWDNFIYVSISIFQGWFFILFM